MILFSPLLKSESGLTLIEILMVIALIGVLSYTSITVFDTNLDEGRFNETFREMTNIRNGMIGDTTLFESGTRPSFGYLGDIGSIPTNAQGLNALLTIPAGFPNWALNSNVRFGLGWNGPYLLSAPGVDYTKDAWGNAYQYDATANPPYIRSLGSDGAVGGSGFAQDITLTMPASERVATVHGFVSESGAPYLDLAQVELNDIDGSGNLRQTLKDIAVADKGYFSFTNVPFGKRSVTIYIQTKATPAQTIGPVFMTIDRANFVTPLSVLDKNTGGEPYDPGGCTNNGRLSFIAGSASLSAGNKKLNFNVNITQPLFVNFVRVAIDNTETLKEVKISAETRKCSGANRLTPCPLNDSTLGSFQPGINLVASASATSYLLFSNDISKDSLGNPTTLIVIEFFYSGGCDTLNVTL